MTVSITLKGTPDSDEYRVAEKIQNIFKSQLPSNLNGHILIRSGAKIMGGEVKDIDIFIVGKFNTPLDLQLLSRISGDSNSVLENRKIKIISFCICIELKLHDALSVWLEGEKLFVNYDNRPHDVAEQSENQKIALIRFIKDHLDFNPYICNMIWLDNINSNSIKNLVGDLAWKNHSHNYLPNDIGLKFIFQGIMMQHLPFQSIYGADFISSAFSSKNHPDLISKIDSVFDLFEKTKQSLGTLTRSQIERMTKKILENQQYAKELGTKMIIFSGGAGTGKTLKLLRIACDLAINQQKRCLIMSYNHALVSDIRRLIHFADLPDGIDRATVGVRTLDSFFYRLLKSLDLLDEKKSYRDYRKDYIHDMINYLNIGALTQVELDKALLQSQETHWDYVLIDEAQDWSPIEKEIVIRIFRSENLLIADGIDQMIRSQERLDWSKGIEAYKPPAEKKCWRQKKNLVSFVNNFANVATIKRENLQSRDDMLGGRIIILEGNYTVQFHTQLYDQCKDSGNSAYEMMILVPPNLVNRDHNQRSTQLEGFDKANVKFWDATDTDLRQEYPVDVEEHRLLQYDSCRGLEAWTVVCLQMDKFIEWKIHQYHQLPQQNSLQMELGLSSPQEKAREYAYKWAIIPFTRAIDSLVITLTNSESEFGKILRSLHKKFPDFIEWRK